MITTIERGGAENQLLVLIKEQIKANYQVEVIYLKGDDELRIRIESLGAVVYSNIANKPIYIQIFGLRNHLNSFKGIIHAHLPRAELLTKIAVPFHNFVITRHNSEAFFPKAPKRFSRYLSRWVTSGDNQVIAISLAVKNFLYENFEVSLSKNIHTVLYGYDNSANYNLGIQDALRTQYNLKNTDFVIGTIGRFVNQKDYPTLFKAFKKFAEQNANAKLIIIGKGELQEFLHLLARELGIHESIIWVGRTSDIGNHLKLMNAFVLASKYEGFGLVLLEAMSANIPIIASKNSAIPEVLGSNHPGLCPTSNFECFTNKLILLTNPDFRKEILEFQGRQFKLFSPEVMQAKVSDIYSSLS